MKKTIRSWDVLTEEQRKKYIKEIIAYFQDERGEEIGIIAAEQILDFFLEHIGIEIHNTALRKAQDVLKKKIEDIDIEIDILKKQK